MIILFLGPKFYFVCVLFPKNKRKSHRKRKRMEKMPSGHIPTMKNIRALCQCVHYKQ
jgi:hypothetical protein